MSSSAISISVFSALLTTATGSNTLNFNAWTKTNTNVGGINVKSPTSLDFTFVAPAGNYYNGPVALPVGTFCLNVVPPTTNGVILQMMLNDGTGDNIDQLEFDWYNPSSSLGQVAINLWNSTGFDTVLSTGSNIFPVPNSISAYYCLTWQVGGSATWYIDGIQMQRRSLKFIKYPLVPQIRLWGALTQPWFLSLAGPYVGGTAIAHLTNGYLSPTQDINVVTLAPTSQPATVSPSVLPTQPRPSTEPSVAPSFPTLTPTSKPTLQPAVIISQAPAGVVVGSSSSSNSSDPSAGAAIGVAIVIGLVLGLLIVAGAAWYFYKRSPRAKHFIDYFTYAIFPKKNPVKSRDDVKLAESPTSNRPPSPRQNSGGGNPLNVSPTRRRASFKAGDEQA